MPPFKGIPRLYLLSLDVITDTLLSNHAASCYKHGDERDFEDLCSSSPPGMNLGDVISERMLSKCSLSIPLSTLFNRCIPQNIYRLDLTGFVRFGPIDSDIFHEFDEALSALIPKIPLVRVLNLKTHEKFTYIPKVRNHHLYLMGQHLSHLQDLDISYNKLVTGEGLRCLLPCVELRNLYLFKVSASEHHVLTLLDSLPHLLHLGYKSLGNVVQNLRKRRIRRRGSSIEGPPRILRLTHVDNTGSYGHQSGNLRCKPSLLLTIKDACPSVKTLKLRVKDEDVSKFAVLSDTVRNVEFVYNVGAPTSPSDGTIQFLRLSGAYLSSIALVCSSISSLVLKGIAEGCPLLESLWIRCNVFDSSNLHPSLESVKHGHLNRLRILYFRIGENAEIVTYPSYLFPYLLRNAGSTLQEFTVFIHSQLLTDAYIFQLFVELHLVSLRKVLFLVPGENNSGGTLPLTLQTLKFILQFCPDIIKIGNVACWSIPRGGIDSDPRLKEFLFGNYILNIVDKR